MQSSNTKFLFGGLGCGLALACLGVGYFAYIVGNLRVSPSPAGTMPPDPTVDSASLITPTPIFIFQVTEPVGPTPLAETFSLTPIPSPIPGSFGDIPPVGKIAFACYIKQIDQICLMSADGTNRVQLTDFKATAFYPSISPDGSTVYFSSKQDGGFEIYSISVDGGEAQRLTNDIGSLYAPELSPNGEWILFTNQGNGLWLMRPDGKNPHALTNRDDIDPTWSLDGSMIAFASSRAGDRQLFVMDADGTNIRQVTNLDNMGGRSTFSPDGTKLAFYRGPAGDHNIYVINIDGTGLVQLTNGGDNLGPSWSPDGNWIAFTSYRDGNNEIYIIHPDGTGLTRLTNTSISDWQPRWGN
ncbi:MAG: PD40 domain-containing protein [Anaerolineales bacterium]|nr:PD40 domain-containing protein [Anaerolineales bacterium]